MGENASASKPNKLGAVFGPTQDCLDIGELTLVLEGRRGTQAQSMTKAHVAACAYCATELALFREFESPAIRPDEQAHVNAITARLRKNSPAAPLSSWKSLLGQFWTPRILAPVSIGFAALLVAITIGIQSRHSPGQPVILPGNEVIRSQSIAVIAPVGDQTRQLEWRAAEGAVRYEIRVIEVDQTEVWRTTVSQTSVQLPPSIQERIVPLKTLLWQVTAFDASGTVVASSGRARFRLQGR
jgi:hypothetical protein